MQSELLPELPSNTSEALNSLVRNLNKFNNTFAQNTTNLGNALNAVNQSYAIQADIIKAVHDMDIMKMAKANVRVLEELQQCTDKLEKFNLYLNDVEGYTKAIHRFESLYHEQVDKIHILEEIRDFFGRHKGEIAKTTADADRILQESLQSIRESTSLNVDEFHKYFVEQSEVFKAILKTEQEELEQFTSELKDQFNIQMSNMPQVAKRLEDIAAIPIQLDKLIDKIEYSNVKLANDISQSVKQSLMSITSKDILDDKERNYAQDTMPNWMKISGWIALIIIAIVGIMNIVFTLFPINNLNV